MTTVDLLYLDVQTYINLAISKHALQVDKI